MPCLDKDRRGDRSQVIRKLLPGLDVRVYLLSMIEIVCQGGINICECEAGMLGYDFIGAQTHAFVPDDNVLYLDPVPCNPWLAATDAWAADDVLNAFWSGGSYFGFHVLMISGIRSFQQPEEHLPQP